jgi:hypothetical protein
LVIGAVSLAIGCTANDPRQASTERISSADARAALEKALTTWRQGRTHAAPKTGESGILFVDHGRKPAQVLRAFKILTESTRANTRQYRVKLELEAPEETVHRTYVVFGDLPTWVYRLEDFDMIMHWDHPMEESTDAGATGSPSKESASVPSSSPSEDIAKTRNADGPSSKSPHHEPKSR